MTEIHIFQKHHYVLHTLCSSVQTRAFQNSSETTGGGCSLAHNALLLMLSAMINSVEWEEQCFSPAVMLLGGPRSAARNWPMQHPQKAAANQRTSWEGEAQSIHLLSRRMIMWPCGEGGWGACEWAALMIHRKGTIYTVNHEGTGKSI